MTHWASIQAIVKAQQGNAATGVKVIAHPGQTLSPMTKVHLNPVSRSGAAPHKVIN